MIARVPNPDAHRGDGDGATAAPPTAPFIHGAPLSQVVKEMTDAGVPQQVIRQYVNDAMAGKPVPPHTKFTQAGVAQMLQSLPKKGRRNAQTP